MNILIIGANGQLGNEMRNVSEKSSDRYVFTDVTEAEGLETLNLDITDSAAVEKTVLDLSVNVIVNCAAFTNVDAAEDDFQLADKLNRAAVGNLASAAEKSGAALIQISTDYVFDGSGNVPYDETSQPSPTSVYGSTKLAGEKALEESGCDYIIIRTAWLYSPYGKNFVKTMRQLTREKDSLRVVVDQVGTPTYAADLAAVIYGIISSRQFHKRGVYHYSNEGAVSWFDFAQAICELSGNECDIMPCLSGEFPSKVRRPNYSVLDKTKIKKVFGITIPYWRDSLEKCLKRM